MTGLPEIADILYGYPFPSSAFSEEAAPGGLPIIRIRDVVPGYSKTVFVGPYDIKYLVSNGDMLIGMDGEFNLARWRGGPALLNQRVCKIIPRQNVVDGHYLFWSLQPVLKVIEDVTPFVTVKHLSAKALSKIVLKLPPLGEQRRIAAILDKADAIRRKRKEAIALTEQLLRSTFLEMFGDPVTNPKRWPDATLADLGHTADKINYGIVQPGQETLDGVPTVRVGDFENLGILKGSLKRVGSEIEAQYARSRLVGDEILIACVGSIGKVALCEPDMRGFNIVRAVTRVRLAPQYICHREFFAVLLTLRAAQEYFVRETRTVAQPTLNIEQIKLTPMLIPDGAARERFCQLFRSLQALTCRMGDSRAQAEALFNSLVQRAFTGRL